MNKVQLDYRELRKAAKGYHADIAERMGISTVSVWARLSNRVKMTLDDLNTMCEVIKREPRDFLKFDEDKGFAASDRRRHNHTAFQEVLHERACVDSV